MVLYAPKPCILPYLRVDASALNLSKQPTPLCPTSSLSHRQKSRKAAEGDATTHEAKLKRTINERLIDRCSRIRSLLLMMLCSTASRPGLYSSGRWHYLDQSPSPPGMAFASSTAILSFRGLDRL